MPHESRDQKAHDSCATECRLCGSHTDVTRAIRDVAFTSEADIERRPYPAAGFSRRVIDVEFKEAAN